ncbi:MAG: TetR family transcriptional regulator C-terminal domain-containing protein [Ornithinimicrobium sp.]
MAITAAATTATHFEPIVRKADAEVVEALTLIARAQEVGSIRTELQTAAIASLLLAVVDVLSVRALTHPDPSDLLAELDHFLNALILTRSRC